jgi:hypothetical protein
MNSTVTESYLDRRELLPLSTKKEVPDYLKGRSIKDVATDLDNGKLAVDQIHIEVFEYNGVLVSTNTRGLAP